jgi:outer membrane protein TolC
LYDLLRAGQLYLSLDDAIALTLENNLEIEIQRFGGAIADSDLLRTQGGSLPRGLNLTVFELPQGVGGPGSSILNLPSARTGTSATSAAADLSDFNAMLPGRSSSSLTGELPLSNGPPVPAFDTAIVGQLNLQHTTTLEAIPFIFGTSTLESRSLLGSFGVQKAFGLGTQVSTTYSSNAQSSNSIRTVYNPYRTETLGVSVVQPLLRGFGRAVNRRYIRISENNQALAGLVFRSQVIATAAGLIRLYYDLVSLAEDTTVKRRTLELARRLYDDTKSKVELGVSAPIELTRAQAQIASARQDLANADGRQTQQELLFKTILSRMGTGDAALRDAHIIPTTSIDVPSVEPVRSVQDLVAEAFENRPEWREASLQIANLEVGLSGSRNRLQPEVNLVGVLQNNALAGGINPAASAPAGAGLLAAPDRALVGGFGDGILQILRHNYPSYGIGLQVNLPLHNRAAEADYARDELQVRQALLRKRQLESQLRLEVESAVVAVHQARVAYEAALEARKLQEQSLDTEFDKYRNGLSTSFFVLQYQTFLAQAQSVEVAAKGTYAKAKAALERAIGMTLENHGISLDEVYRGQLSSQPAPLPAGSPGSLSPSIPADAGGTQNLQSRIHSAR